jgi:O-antigen ligase
MSEPIRALVYILAIALPSFWFARIAFAGVVRQNELVVWSSCWLVVTSAAFIVHDFWAYIGLLSVCIVLYSWKSTLTGPKLFLFLICAMPFFENDIPGFGALERVTSVSHYKVLAILTLLPFAWQRQAEPRLNLQVWIDRLVLALFLLSSVLIIRDATLTNTIRTSLDLLAIMYLPYVAMSRAIVTKQALRETMAAYLVPFVALSLLGLFEFFRGWHLYDQLNALWGTYTPSYGYIWRHGRLRAYASVSGGPIIFGYCIMIAMGFLLAFWNRGIRPRHAIGLAGLLTLGIVSSVSRGPWLGAIAMVLVFIAAARGGIRKLMVYGVLVLAFATPLFLSHSDESPGEPVSTEEAENVEYRQRLLETSLIVISRHPMLGSTEYINELANMGMVQGQGIVDIVNSYLQIALQNGLVGLFLFVSIFLLIVVRLYRTVRALPAEASELEQMGRALLATLIGVLITIFTVSSIGQAPMLYWSLAGIAVAYDRIARASIGRNETGAAATPGRPAGMVPA